MKAEKKDKTRERRYIISVTDIQDFLAVAPIADTTKSLYGIYLDNFFYWLTSKKIERIAVTPILIIEWMGENPKWSASTRYNAAAAIRSFLKWKFGSDHPGTQIKIRRINPPPQRSLDSEELIKLCKSIDISSSEGLRDLAIIALMADTGMRATEVCNLELKNLDLKKLSLTCLVKGGKWATKVYSDATAHGIQRWLNVRGKIAKPGVRTVFVSMSGRKRGQPLTRNGLYELFERLASKADLGKITPHAMRRTFATLSIENGAPTRLIQIAGGWESIAMVERYTRNLKADRIKMYLPFSKMGDEEIT